MAESMVYGVVAGWMEEMGAADFTSNFYGMQVAEGIPEWSAHGLTR